MCAPSLASALGTTLLCALRPLPAEDGACGQYSPSQSSSSKCTDAAGRAMGLALIPPPSPQLYIPWLPLTNLLVASNLSEVPLLIEMTVPAPYLLLRALQQALSGAETVHEHFAVHCPDFFEHFSSTPTCTAPGSPIGARFFWPFLLYKLSFAGGYGPSQL
ncbi:hypothetical protein DFP72DRAFT_856404 [Ephemerocybe angulata]|uniref:Secreted protein n=1 Tax=Ephemerocybe angulata TaxID=980116 RepID=A0A8H6HFU3_9AGAR|nr:hypothetical protein DFP72DRAFT_856404 [Tulosesus angulatus]